ncbi:MAG: co-chaperone GroES [Patescibacteria group bacterium]
MIQPLRDKIVVRPKKSESQTHSGIYIPDSAKKDIPQEGEVLAVGPGKVNQDGSTTPVSVKVGDTVVFNKYGPAEVTIDGEELYILSESDVLGIIV